ncbi:ROK family protein [Bifidobacterium sp. 82T24]|uniref:ROK family protein n=2 Tax=Bifidobacterium TaxID=1678 RepID=A0ABX0CA18_9BIFI|nr:MULTISPECIES: ROK family protein [Bifidobacterium]MBW3088332.1 ROK family protein [Bifidobacterium pluvialisilvae]NEG97039.1 ROK family protein [Bifidobacterium sp. SMB2]NEH11978.1 ROK family protein [Bifidobacterium saimiriisciurei]
MSFAGISHQHTVMSVDIGGTKIAAGLMQTNLDEQAKIQNAPTLIRRCVLPTEAHLGGAFVLQRVAQAIRQCLDAGEIPFPLLGIGVASAGVIDGNGSVLSATSLIPGWAGIRLQAELSTAFDLPVAVIGDVQAHALGEARWGCGRQYQSMLVAAIGTGIGGAIIVDGKLIRGVHGACGHIGHLPHPDASGIPCSCGHEGHVESIASGTGIADNYRRIMQQRGQGTFPSDINGRTVAELATHGNAEAARSIATAGTSLGDVLGGLINVFDPDAVILSGSVVQSGERWMKYVEYGIQRQALGLLSKTPVLAGTLGGQAPLIGAAEALCDKISNIKQGAEI